MSEIKDNEQMQEVAACETGECENLCCYTCQNTTYESQCKEGCCQPKTIVCPDIREAKCIPALIDRIYDCICLKSEQTRCAKDKLFTITSACTGNINELVGKEICIKTITLQYDCLGINESSIETEIGVDSKVTLVNNGSSNTTNTTCQGIYTEYSGTLNCGLGTGCCENGRRRKICQSDITPDACNLSIIVEGTAGCVPFVAQYVSDNTSTTGGLDFKEVDFFGQICLPDNRKRIELSAIFDVCISIPCIAPKSNITNMGPIESGGPSVYGFTANIFASLLVTEKLYAVVKDEMAVYTTPNKISCTNGGFTSNCKCEC